MGQVEQLEQTSTIMAPQVQHIQVVVEVVDLTPSPGGPVLKVVVVVGGALIIAYPT